MAHFAKLNSRNEVTAVVVGRQEDDGKELELTERTGDVYKQTSYNTRGGVHYNPETGEPSEDQTKAFRFNYAGIGYTFDETKGENGAFIPPKRFDSWVLDEATCIWTAPIEYPADGGFYTWDEKLQEWTAVENETE